MQRGKVLFIDTAHPVLTADLTGFGFQCDYFEDYNREDFIRAIPEYCGIIVRGKITLDEDFLSKASNLKFIGRVGAGMENIDVGFAESRGIACLNAPEGNRDAVGEHTLGMLLMLMNNLRKADNEVRKSIWIREGNRGHEIKGKTVGIVGYGNMGGAFAQRLKGFNARVIAYDKYKFGYSDEFVEEVDMETIFTETNILSLHVPLTDETEYLVDDSYLKKFRKNIYVINTARGKVLNTSSLVHNMKTGKVIGACLDVLEYEKMSFEAIGEDQLPENFKYLVNSDRVVLSPHIAGWTHESNFKLAKVIVGKVMDIFV
ncbi:MAG: hydroxyacid dehydrogenase [Bacteroidetes bacterium 4572_114]|nr:MAG: hydroxyacid dehydrogenase [Bacteroidetes bacterium 4572_114]